MLVTSEDRSQALRGAGDRTRPIPFCIEIPHVRGQRGVDANAHLPSSFPTKPVGFPLRFGFSMKHMVDGLPSGSVDHLDPPAISIWIGSMNATHRFPFQ
jgi:hypothetical protein